MSRPITFATQFPARHPLAGVPTFFAEKIMAGLADANSEYAGWQMPNDFAQYDWHQYYNASPKLHTIRRGFRWKLGDAFSPRIWSSKPYASKQLTFSPDLCIRTILPIRISYQPSITIQLCPPGTSLPANTTDHQISAEMLDRLAINDGLTTPQLLHWFSIGVKEPYQPFEGQLLSWFSHHRLLNYHAH